LLRNLTVQKHVQGAAEGVDKFSILIVLNPLNAKLNPICHLLALLGAHHIFHVSRIRVKLMTQVTAYLSQTLTKLWKFIAHTQMFYLDVVCLENSVC